jgi:hypothetical protein
MNFIKKLMGAANTHPANKTTLQKTCHDTSIAIKSLQALRDFAWQNANKYRWDPTIGPLHADYLNNLNMLLQECGS